MAAPFSTASRDALVALQKELEAVNAERTALQTATAATLQSVEVQVLAAEKRAASAAQTIASRVAELTTSSVSGALSSANAAVASQRSAVQAAALVVAQAKEVAISQANLEAQLLQELRDLRAEEEARAKRCAGMEASLKVSQDRIRAATNQFDMVLSHISQVKAALVAREAQDEATLKELEAKRDDARRTIAETSEAHARRVMAVWDEQTAAAIQETEARFDGEADAVKDEARLGIAEYLSRARAKAHNLAVDLAKLTTQEYTAVVAPMLNKLENARSAHAAVASQLATARERLMALLQDVRNGADPGTDLATFAEAFPLLDGARAADGTADGAAVGGGSRSGMAALLAGLPEFNVDAALEARDAASLNLTLPAAKHELHALMDKTVARWEKMPGADVDEVLDFLRQTQERVAGALPGFGGSDGGLGSVIAGDAVLASSAALRAASQPSGGRGALLGEGEGATLVTHAGLVYGAEADRLRAFTAITSAETRLIALEAQREALQEEIATLRTHDPNNLDALEAAVDAFTDVVEPQLRETAAFLRAARAAYDKRFVAGSDAGEAEASHAGEEEGVAAGSPVASPVAAPAAAAPLEAPAAGSHGSATVAGLSASLNAPVKSLFSPTAAGRPAASPAGARARPFSGRPAPKFH